MAKIQCELCPKVYKTQSGLAWHTQHIHRAGVASALNGGMPAAQPQAEGELPVVGGATTPTLKEIVTMLSEQTTGRLEELEALVESTQDATQKIAEHQSSLSQRVVELENQAESLGQFQRQLGDLSSEVDSVRQELGRMSPIMLALVQLVWDVDVDRRPLPGLLKISERKEAPANSDQAREVLRQFLRAARTPDPPVDIATMLWGPEPRALW